MTSIRNTISNAADAAEKEVINNIVGNAIGLTVRGVVGTSVHRMTIRIGGVVVGEIDNALSRIWYDENSDKIQK